MKRTQTISVQTAWGEVTTFTGMPVVPTTDEEVATARSDALAQVIFWAQKIHNKYLLRVKDTPLDEVGDTEASVE